jgi:hypothetical protein
MAGAGAGGRSGGPAVTGGAAGGKDGSCGARTVGGGGPFGAGRTMSRKSATGAVEQPISKHDMIAPARRMSQPPSSCAASHSLRDRIYQEQPAGRGSRGFVVVSLRCRGWVRCAGGNESIPGNATNPANQVSYRADSG